MIRSEVRYTSVCINGSVNVVILLSGSGGQIGFIQKGKFQF